MAGPGNILIRVGAEAGQAISELGRVNNVMGQSMTRSEKMGAALRKAAIPATIALTAIAVGSKKAIDAASNLNEVVNKSEVVFGKSGKTVVEWSKGLAASFGLSSREALEAASQFGNMLVPMGYTRKEAAKMSTQMVELAGDMASFNNASPEETLAAIQSGIAGQSEPLRKYGVFLDQTRIKNQALAMGLYSGKGALDAQAKAAATMQIILKDTADTQGDFARTSDSAANQARIQAAETENLSAALGQGLLPYYQAGQKLLISFTRATAAHTGVVKVLVGIVAGLSAAILVANAAFKAWAIVQNVARVATIAFTAANRLLTASLLTNPVFLITAAIVALGVAFVVAYKKSETFRNIVNGALAAVANAARAVGNAFVWLWGRAQAAFGWITAHWKLAAFALGPLGAGIVVIATHFDRIKSAASSAFGVIERAIRGVIDAVRDLIGWLGKIKVPKINLPHIPKPFAYGYAYGGPAPAVAGYAAGGGPSVVVNFYGPTDAEGAAREIGRVLRAHEVRQGRAPMRAG